MPGTAIWDPLGRKLLALAPTLSDTSNPARFPERLQGTIDGACPLVRTSEIDWCEAAGNYVRLRLRNESHLFRETMNGLESKLNPRHFAPSIARPSSTSSGSRSCDRRSAASATVFLRDGTKPTLSRGYRESVQERFGKSP